MKKKEKQFPRVSVIIPLFNHEKFIGRCLRSLLSQTLDKNEFEIIIVDDCSKDNSLKALNPYKNHIKIIKNKKNLGLPSSLNKGIELSKGSFVVRVDSDDWVDREYLRILYLHLKINNNLDAVSCDYNVVDESQNYLRSCNSEKHPIGCGIMFRIEHLIDIGAYDGKLRMHEEVDLTIRFLKKFKIYRVPLSLYRYRQHLNNLSKQSTMKKSFLIKLKKKHINK